MVVSVAAIVPAAGRGDRLGGGAPKALRMLRGEPLLVHAVRSLRADPDVGSVVLAAPADRVDAVTDALGTAGLGAGVTVVAGSGTRQDSVVRALTALPADADVVLVHDAARPLVPVGVVRRVLAAVRSGADAVVPVVPVADTVKRVEGDEVVATVDRGPLRQVQTPQGFRREVLERAYAAASDLLTDDAGLVERMGVPVHVVDGHAEAFKITGPLDLLVAEAVLAARG